MNSKSGFVSSLLLATALASSILGTACADHHYYRVYDASYSDYHVWNDDETVYYRQWARENHRDENREFRRLKPEEKKEYWNWRHKHGDHDRDKDKDKDHDRH